MRKFNSLAIVVVIGLISSLVGSSNANGDASRLDNWSFGQGVVTSADLQPGGNVATGMTPGVPENTQAGSIEAGTLGNVNSVSAQLTLKGGDVIIAGILPTNSVTQQATADPVPTVETDPVPHGGDAADDIAIWVHPTDPSLSTVIGTDKQGGLAVYDLDGTEIQYLAVGDINNVDIRYNFPLNGLPVTIVTAGNRANASIAIYRVNPSTRLLENVAARTITVGIDTTYGSCMYRSPKTGNYYFIVNDKAGNVEQWELFDDLNGKVDAAMVRTFGVGSITEGCVADDELGHLYIGEEDVGIWKYGAEPADGSARTLVDSIDAGGHLTADVEGLTLYYASNGTGYLIASSQGSNKFVVYQREANNDYLVSFKISAGNGIDGLTSTDGIDVTNFPLGPAFPQGVFIAQDDTNTGNDGTLNQNFKLVQWSDIAQRTGLSSDTSRNPRLSVSDPQVSDPAPSIQSVIGSETSVEITFSEPLDPANIGNYSVSNGITASNASLGVDQKTVTLTASAHTPGVDYTLTVTGVMDPIGNAMPLTQAVYRFELTNAGQTLAGQWTFDEGASTIAEDSSGNGHTGTLENGTEWVPGILNSAVGFSGSTDQVQVADSADLNFGSQDDFSISFWFKDSTKGLYELNSAELLEKQDASGVFYQVRSPNTIGALRFQIDDGTNQDSLYTSAGDLADGQWHHVVFIRDHNVGISAYVNGNPAGSNNIITAGSLVNGAPLIFGAGNTFGDTYDGGLDQVRIYRQALSTAEISALFNAP